LIPYHQYFELIKRVVNVKANFLEKLWKIKTVENKNDVKAMRKFYDEIQTSTRSLEALGVAEDSYII
jgi:hypothetical protein